MITVVRIFIIIGIIAASLFFESCKNSNSNSSSNEENVVKVDTVMYDEIDKIEENDFIWYRYKVNGLAGALDQDKKVIIEAQYEMIVFDDNMDMYYAKRNNYVELLKRDGSVFISQSRFYNNILKETLSSKDRFYYLIYQDNGLHGVCNEKGEEIIVPRFSNIDYENASDTEPSHYDSSNPIGLYGSFVSEDNDGNKFIFDIYIDSNGHTKKLSGRKWIRYYKSDQLYSQEDAQCIDSKVKSIFRCYDGFIMDGFRKYKIVSENKVIDVPSEGNYAMIINEDDGGYTVDENILLFSKESIYMREWEKIKEVKISEFWGKGKVKGNNASESSISNNMSPYQGGYSNYYPQGTYTPANSRQSNSQSPNQKGQPVRHDCNLCGGSKRIVKDTYPPLYGAEDYKVRCNECGGYFMRSMGHTHITCPQCHGRGYFTTE